MDNTLTYKKLLDFPNDFKVEASKYQEMADLISKSECEKYDIMLIKSSVDVRFQKFKDARYIYQYPNEKYYTSVTTNYTPREGMCQRSKQGAQESNIQKDFDKTVWVNKMYYAFMESIASKLTADETVYFIDTYFRRYTEDIIKDNLCITKAKLQNIKHSCIIKLWIEMEALKEFEDFK